MEQLLAFLLEYGIFVGIVILTVILIWGSYAIYNAIVRAKTAKVSVTPIATETLKSVEVTPVEKTEIKTPSLEGEGVIKTGPRKMVLDEHEEPKVIQETKTVIEENPLTPPVQQPLASELNKESDIKEILEDHQAVEQPKVEITPLVVDTPKTLENQVIESEESPIENHEALPIKSTPRRIILPKDEDDSDIVKPKPKEKKSTTIKKLEPHKPIVEPKGIIVQKPKPKKKLPPKFHVLYRASDDSWYVKVEGNDSIISILETQREAISYATIKALRSDSVVIVHRKDGKIRKQATMKDVTDSEEEE